MPRTAILRHAAGGPDAGVDPSRRAVGPHRQPLGVQRAAGRLESAPCD